MADRKPYRYPADPDRRPAPPPPDGPAGPYGKPPRVPPNKGDQQWWQDRRVPRQWQEEQPQRRQPAPRRDGQGSADAYREANPQEQDRMLRGAYQAGINGDDGAMQSFPNTPFGQRLRQEFMRGRQQRQKPNRGLGFSGLDRG